MKKLLIITIVLVSAMAMVFAGASTEQPAQSAGPKKAASQVYYEGFPTAGQGQSSFITTTAHRLDSTVNEPGVAITWKGELKNLLVESYEMQEEGKVWILHIRQDAKWHDGEDVTAEDFIWSYSAWANPRVATRWKEKAKSIAGYEEINAGTTDTLSGVTKIDSKTVRVELNHAMPLWMKLEQTYLVIFPYHIFKDVKSEDVVGHSYWKNRIGTGPFKWAEYKADQYIKLVRNESYYGGAPILEEVYYVIFTDAAAMLNAYASGEIHTTFYEGTSITPADRAYYAGLADHYVVTMDKGSASCIMLNNLNEDWSKKEIRQALMYAIDIDSILANLYPGAIKARTLFPQRWTWTESLDQYAYNPELAKKMLAEAGFSGKTHNMTYTQSDALTQNLLVAVQQYLAAVGVNITLQKIDAAATAALNSSGNQDMSLAGTGVGLDPSLAESLIGRGTMLGAGYDNDRVNELFAIGKTLVDQADRAPVYQEISFIINEEVPKVFLWFDIRDLGFSTKVVGPREHYEEQGTILFNMGVYNEINTWYVVE
jgi:peptide/nickel transport system substrate-binding protein